MTDQIQPALYPSQWRDVLGIDQTIAPALWPRNRRFWIERALKLSDDYRGEHAVAAICLHQQPYGFTPDDPYILREVAEAMEKLFDSPKLMAVESLLSAMGQRVRVRCYADELHSLADRIEALLPPKE